MAFTIFNVGINTFSILIGLIILFESTNNKVESVNQKLFDYLVLIAVFTLLVDIGSWLINGKLFQGAKELHFLIYTIYYTLQISYCFIWLFYTEYWLHGSSQKIKKHLLFYSAPLCIAILLTLSNHFTNMVFVIDEQNVYHRGYGYNIYLILILFYVFATLAFVLNGRLKSGNNQLKKQSNIMAFAVVAPVITTFLQGLYYGLSLIWPSAMLALVIIYTSIQQNEIMNTKIGFIEQKEQIVRLENELTQNRISIMLSQIQPHFLYNILTSIAVLCDENPVAAKGAILDFSKYLRNNLDSLNQSELIPFMEELNHVKNYINLEKIRFEDELIVQYDIITKNFLLPALTIQPLVENAVKHGISRKAEQGCITLSTGEDENDYIITIRDNGAGFDPNAIHKDGSTHVGIENVRKRIEVMCKGTLEITSKRNEGTTAIIRLPKRREKSCI